MPRPARKNWIIRTSARRRHRSWMRSMVFATCGWTTWWTTLLLARIAPSLALPEAPVFVVSSAFAICGLLLALWTIRAEKSWILFTSVPLLANSTLLMLPWLVSDSG